MPQADYYNDHTLVVIGLPGEGLQGYAPTAVQQCGKRLLVQLQWQEEAEPCNGRVYLLSLPKTDAFAAGLAYSGLPKETFVTETYSYKDNWVNDETAVLEPDAVLTSVNDLETYMTDLISSFEQDESHGLADPAAFWREDVAELDHCLTEGFFERFHTVAFRYTHQGIYRVQLESVSADGLITLTRCDEPEKGDDTPPDGAISSDLILINLPVTDSMPEAYSIQFATE